MSGTSISGEGGGLKVKIKRALSALADKDNSYNNLWVDGSGNLWVRDKALEDIYSILNIQNSELLAIINELNIAITGLTKNTLTIIYRDSVSGALSFTTALQALYKDRDAILKSFEVTWSAAPTTSESLTITKSSNDSRDPDTVIYSLDPSLASATSLFQDYEAGGVPIPYMDELTIAYTNTDANTVKYKLTIEVS